MAQFITSFRKLILAGGDFTLLFMSLFLALFIRYGKSFDRYTWNEHASVFLFVFIMWIAVFYLFGLYEEKLAKNGHKFYFAAVKATLTAGVLSVIFFYLAPASELNPKTNLALTAALFFGGFSVWRYICNALIQSAHFLNNTIFIGVNKEALDIISMLKENPQLGYKIELVFEYAQAANADILAIARDKKISTIVYSSKNNQAEIQQTISKMLYNLIPLRVDIIDLPKFYAEIMKKVPISIIGETWFLENLIETEKKPYEMGKRILDILTAIFLGIIVFPIIPFIALAIKIGDPGKIFYTQKRIGKNGIIFELLKFRTMVENAEADGVKWTVSEDQRITRVGKFLRKTRIDELPQLWNVIKGDMSFVGPRPERREFINTLEKEIPHYQMRHLVRPGLTGWAQIHQPRGGASVEDSMEKLQYDLYYIKNRNLILDLDVILKTIPIVLKREGH